MIPEIEIGLSETTCERFSLGTMIRLDPIEKTVLKLQPDQIAIILETRNGHAIMTTQTHNTITIQYGLGTIRPDGTNTCRAGRNENRLSLSVDDHGRSTIHLGFQIGSHIGVIEGEIIGTSHKEFSQNYIDCFLRGDQKSASGIIEMVLIPHQAQFGDELEEHTIVVASHLTNRVGDIQRGQPQRSHCSEQRVLAIHQNCTHSGILSGPAIAIQTELVSSKPSLGFDHRTHMCENARPGRDHEHFVIGIPRHTDGRIIETVPIRSLMSQNIRFGPDRVDQTSIGITEHSVAHERASSKLNRLGFQSEFELKLPSVVKNQWETEDEVIESGANLILIDRGLALNSNTWKMSLDQRLNVIPEIAIRV